MSYELLSTLQIEGVRWRQLLHSPKPGLCYVYFTNTWKEKGHSWCGGKYFEITKTLVVPFSRTVIIPANDYCDYDLSNVEDRGAVKGLKLYPEAEGKLHEILVGFKPGRYLIYPAVSTGDKSLLTLAEPTMYPDITDAIRKYIALKPEDSPHENPVLKLWAVMKMVAWVLRLYVLEGTYEKVTVEFKVARHDIVELKEPPPVFTTIRHPTELMGV